MGVDVEATWRRFIHSCVKIGDKRPWKG